MFFLIATIAVMIGFFLFVLQLLKCNYCPRRKECEKSVENGGDPLCEHDNK